MPAQVAEERELRMHDRHHVAAALPVPQRPHRRHDEVVRSVVRADDGGLTVERGSQTAQRGEGTNRQAGTSVVQILKRLQLRWSAVLLRDNYRGPREFSQLVDQL